MVESFVDMTSKVLRVVILSILTMLLTYCSPASKPPEQSEAASPSSNSNSAATEQSSGTSADTDVVISSGTVEVTSTPPGATIILIPLDGDLDGVPKPRGSTPATLTDVPPGKYTVHLEKPGYRYFQKEVEVKMTETVKVNAKLKKE
jgi:hypothetical protein